MPKVIVGLYERIENARDAVQELMHTGFAPDSVSLVAARRDNRRAGGPQEYEKDYQVEKGTKDPAEGAGEGALLGGLTGLVIGAGLLAIPGIGPVLAAGPLVGALAGAGVGAASGGLFGALILSGIPNEEAGYYSEAVRRGDILVTVNTPDDMADRAIEIMEGYDPVDVQRRVEEWRSTGWTGYDDTAGPHEARGPEIAHRDAMAAGDVWKETGADRAPGQETDTSFDIERERELQSDGGGVAMGSVEQSRQESGAYDDRFLERARTGDTAPLSAEDTSDWADDGTDYSRGADYNLYERELRRNYDKTYASSGLGYDRYESAYRYGYVLGTTDDYADRQWSDIENEARSKWEAEHRESGTWEQVKQAICHGWAEVRGEVPERECG